MKPSDQYRRPDAHQEGQLDDLWRAFDELADEVAAIREDMAADADPEDDGDSEGEADDAQEEDEAPAPGINATPGARTLANEKGVDLADVTGTGSSGYITRDDVEDFLGGEGEG